MIDLGDISNNLYLNKQGVWVSKHSSQVSYPEMGSEELQSDTDSFWRIHRGDCLMKVLTNHPPGGTIFDIGGGDGYLCSRFNSEGFESILVEPNQHGVATAIKKRNLENVICSTLHDAQFKKNTIPAIGFFDVMEHVSNDLEFLRQIRSILKRDGNIYLTVPAYQMLWSQEDVFLGHFRRYSLTLLQQKLNAVGFKIKYATYIFSFLPIPIFFVRTFPSKLGLRYKSSFKKIKRELNPRIGIGNNLLKWFLSYEINKVSKNKKLNFGSSCLVVAQASY